MLALSAPKLTGNKRHRVQSIGLFHRRLVLVLQHEFERYVPNVYAGRADGHIKKWWVDALPEWEMKTNE